MYIQKIGVFIIVSVLLLTGCTTQPEEVVDTKSIVEKEWTTYTNDEYGFSIDYPSDLSGNKLSITQAGNKFAVVGLNGINAEFKVPFMVKLNVQSEEDLTKFIKEKYGQTCELAEVLYDEPGDGLYTVNILMDDSLGEGCWVNWITLLKYSPEKQKAVAIDLGQEPPMFEMGDSELIDYTRKTADSFKFID